MSRLWRFLLVGTLAALPLTLVPSTGQASTGTSWWWVSSDPSHPFNPDTLARRTRQIDLHDQDASALVATGTSAHLHLALGGETLDLVPADGDQLVAGESLSDAPPIASRSTGAGVDVQSPDADCQGESRTNATIEEATYDASDQVTSVRIQYEQHCTKSLGALRGSIGWNATSSEPPLPMVAHVRITHDRNFVPYGEYTALTIQLDSDSPERWVSVYEQDDHDFRDRPSNLIARVHVGPTNVAVVRRQVRETRSFIAYADGGFDASAASGTVTTGVRWRIGETLSGSSRSRGRVHLFSHGNCALFGISVLPNRSGHTVLLNFEWWIKKRWVPAVGPLKAKLGAQSSAVVRVCPVKWAYGMAFRARSTWHANYPDYSASPWRYAEFVR